MRCFPYCLIVYNMIMPSTPSHSYYIILCNAGKCLEVIRHSIHAKVITEIKRHSVTFKLKRVYNIIQEKKQHRKKLIGLQNCVCIVTFQKQSMVCKLSYSLPA